MVLRGEKRKGVRYFGPYAHAYAIRETLDLLLRTFPIRTCTQGQVRPPQAPRPAVPLRAHRECAAPCVGDVPRGVRRPGRRAPRVPRRRQRARSSSGSTSRCTSGDTLEFERAARPARPIVRCARPSSASRSSTQGRGLRRDRHRRRRARSVGAGVPRAQGRVVGRKGLVVDKVEDLTRPELVGRMLEQLYGGSTPPTSRAGARARRARRRRALRGVPHRCSRASKVRMRVPQRGAKRELLSTVDAERRGGVHAPQAARRVRPQRPRPRAARAAGGARACPRPRCASSASTSRTSRAPRSSRRWW